MPGLTASQSIRKIGNGFGFGSTRFCVTRHRQVAVPCHGLDPILFAKPTPLNITLSSGRFVIFNKKRDIAIILASSLSQ